MWQFALPLKTGMRQDAHAPGIYNINRTVTFACFHKNMNWPLCCSFSVTYLRKYSQLQNLAVSPFLYKRQICFYHCWSVKLLSSLIFPLRSRLARWDFIWNVTVFATHKISAFQKRDYQSSEGSSSMVWAKEEYLQLLLSCSSGSDLSSFSTKWLQLCLLFVVCKPQIIFAWTNLTIIQVVERRNKVRKGYKHLKYFEGNHGHWRGGHHKSSMEEPDQIHI